MLVKFLKINQPVCIALWFAIVYNLFMPLPGYLYTILLYAGPVLLVGHLSEWIALKGKLEKLGHSGTEVFVKVMVFGFFWWVPAIRSADM